MHASIMPTKTHHVGRRPSNGGGEEERRRLRVCAGRCTTGLLALERFHAPISNETHKPRHTRATIIHTFWWALSLPSYPHLINKKKKVWHVVGDKEEQSKESNLPKHTFMNGCCRVLQPSIAAYSLECYWLKTDILS